MMCPAKLDKIWGGNDADDIEEKTLGFNWVHMIPDYCYGTTRLVDTSIYKKEEKSYV